MSDDNNLTGLGQTGAPTDQPVEPINTSPPVDTEPVQADPSVPPQTIDASPPISTTGNTGSGGSQSNKKKIIATILGIMLLLTSVGAGVYLVQQQQEIRERAKSRGCISFSFVYTDGLSDTGTFCGGNNVGRSDQPGLVANSLHISCSDTIYPDGTAEKSDLAGHLVASFFITKYNEDGSVKKTCGEEQISATPTPTPTHIPTPTPTPPTEPSPTPTKVPTPTPTPPPIGAACLDVKAYDAGWNLLTPSDLTVLEAGDIVRFAVAGTTTSGSFDKVRFTINGTQRAEVTAKKPGSEEFYDEYSVPAGVTSFTISAQIHHTSLGWF